MTQIKVLSSDLINQIAAGEVIERPASIVKELVENSIDSGATFIDIHIKEGGKSYIQVSDNGRGMNEEDLKLAFRRHATSKRKSAEDLVSVRSLGFRGEALPSIASVARVDAVSKSEESSGFEIAIEGGDVKFIRPAAAVQGTSIQVRNLFFNVPARRKFLKKTETEYRTITATVRQYVLAHPEIAFKYIADEREIFILQSADLYNRLRDVYGKRFAEALLHVEFERDQFAVKGFVGNLCLVK